MDKSGTKYIDLENIVTKCDHFCRLSYLIQKTLIYFLVDKSLFKFSIKKQFYKMDCFSPIFGTKRIFIILLKIKFFYCFSISSGGNWLIKSTVCTETLIILKSKLKIYLGSSL